MEVGRSGGRGGRGSRRGRKRVGGRRGVGRLADVGSRSFGTEQKLFCRGRNPAGPEQVVRLPIRELADRKTQR